MRYKQKRYGNGYKGSLNMVVIIDKQKGWQEIEPMLIAESLSLSGSSVSDINNNNNIE